MGRFEIGPSVVEPMSERVCQKVVVNNAEGIHARPADLIAKVARRFASQITVTKGSERVDGKSILSILTLAALPGTELEVAAEGADASAALAALVELFDRNFVEEEPEPAQ